MKITQAVPAMFAALAALTVKTIIKSDWRPLHRVLCTLLLGIAALWAIPRSAQAQLYVFQAYGVGEYDATTGAAINASLITFTGPPPPNNSLVVSGNTLFVANSTTTVGAYNATTGAVINANFITGLGALPIPLAVSGNTLFVANGITVGAFSATTGAAINMTEAGMVTTAAGTATVTFAQPFSQVPNVSVSVGSSTASVTSTTQTGFVVNTVDPTGLPVNATVFWTATGGTGGITGLSAVASAIAVSGNTLYVASDGGPNNPGISTVGAYDATTLAAINPNFITFTGTAPSALAVSGNTLFALFPGTASNNTSTVGAYNATTGAAINPGLITFTGTPVLGPNSLAVSGNTLFLTLSPSPTTPPVTLNTVGTYNATTGAVINANFIPLNEPVVGLAVASGPDSNIPIANAGPNQKAQVGILVTLDGSESSDPTDQLPLTYAWSFVSQPAGSAVTLSDPTIVNPTFTPDALGNYVIQLVVTDAAGLSSTPATVTISTIFDAPPVANAGPDQVITAIGKVVQLNGTASYDLAGLPITYQWSILSQPAGSKATLIGPTTATPSFVAHVRGEYSIQLIVTDSLGTASSPSVVHVFLVKSPRPKRPIANAGPSQSAVVGETVTLNGSKSTDPLGLPLTYKWSLVSAPKGSKATISNPTAKIASFVPDLPGTYVVQLTVYDGFLYSSPATAEIQAVTPQTQLTLNIRRLQKVIEGLPPSAFKQPRLQEDLIKELNAVLSSISAHNYANALEQLQNDILTKVDGCATTGAPDMDDWIINCPDQSMVYTPLLNIIAEVKALVPPPPG